MTFEFKFPDVGEGIEEGELVKWLVKEGDAIKEDDPIAEVETDKAVVEVPSPRDGTVLKLHAAEGDTIKVGQVIVVFGEAGEKVEASKAEAPKKEEQKPEPPKEESKPVTQSKEISVLPAIRKLATDLKVDLSTLTGSGPGGRITEADVKGSVGGSGKTEAPKDLKKVRKYDMFGHVKREAFKGIRKSVADHMLEATTRASLVTGTDEVDVTDLWDIRKKEKVNAEKKKIHLTFLPFIVKSCVHALQKYPYFNAEVSDDDTEIIVKEYHNIGIAVDTDDGLMVPVVKGAGDKSILDIAQDIQTLSEKAKTRKIDLMDLKGGTFTITNYGSVGGIFATPIPNFPEVAILGIGRIQDRVMPAKDGQFEVRKILPLSLTFDHRVVDGAQAQLFLNVIKEHLEDPDLFLVEGK